MAYLDKIGKLDGRRSGIDVEKVLGEARGWLAKFAKALSVHAFQLHENLDAETSGGVQRRASIKGVSDALTGITNIANDFNGLIDIGKKIFSSLGVNNWFG